MNGLDKDLLPDAQKTQLEVILTELGAPTVDPLLKENTKLQAENADLNNKIALLSLKLQNAQDRIKAFNTAGKPGADATFKIGESVTQFIEGALDELRKTDHRIGEFFGTGTELKEFIRKLSDKHLCASLQPREIEEIASRMKEIAHEFFLPGKGKRVLAGLEDDSDVEKPSPGDEPRKDGGGDEPRKDGGGDEPRKDGGGEPSPATNSFWQKVEDGVREDSDDFLTTAFATMFICVQKMSANDDYTGNQTKLEKVYSLYTKPGEDVPMKSLLKEMGQFVRMYADAGDIENLQIACIVAILGVNHYWWKNNLLGIEHNYLSCSRDEQPLFNKITSTQTLQLICYFYGCIFEKWIDFDISRIKSKTNISHIR